jgi:hypothetical protein
MGAAGSADGYREMGYGSLFRLLSWRRGWSVEMVGELVADFP